MSDNSDQNNQTRLIAMGIVIALVLAGGTWWYLHLRAQQPAEVVMVGDVAAAPAVDPAAVPDEPADILHPLEVEPEAEPAADAPPPDPDAAALAGLGEVFPDGGLTDWLLPEQLARRLVATTDNLARNVSVEKLRPLRAPAGRPVVTREVIDETIGTERITLAPANFARYDALVGLLRRTDMASAAAVYRRIYPQLQQAWVELGYPDRYFNDRLVEVIDHLLATPEPAGPLLLEQPKVLYRYADPDLEARSAGQKLLLRIGVDHARVVKRKLTEFRAQIASKE